MKHVTYRGQHVDMELLRFKNQHQIAVGNLKMNARGDILGKGGIIVKTREELLQESEIELTKPDFNPASQTGTYVPEMDKLSFAKKSSQDFTSEDDVVDSEDEEVKTPKRAPRKSQ